MSQKLAPMHPGEVLREEFLIPFRLTPYALAGAIHVPRTRVERIAREEMGVTSDTAVRLARYFGTTPDFWVNLQTRFDLLTAAATLKDEIATIEPRKELEAEYAHAQ